MKKWITKLFFVLLKLLSFLSLSILYVIAKFIQFFLQHILHYRQSVINTNLAYAFSYKSSLEINKIKRKYYHHLSCIIVEIIKYISISKNSINKRISLTHQAKQLLFDLRNEQVPLFVLLGHFGNWEWASYLAANSTNKKAYALYAPSNNITFDNQMKKIRERLGLHTILNSDIKKIIEICQQNNLIAILADQTPVDTDKAYWTSFLGIKTPFHQAYANIAHKQNAIVLYASINKIDKGYYEVDLKAIATPSQPVVNKEDIVEQYVQFLESDIINKPQLWLWSHRRWKRAGIKY